MADPIFSGHIFTVWLRPCTDAGEPGGHAGTSGAGRAGRRPPALALDKDGSYTSKEDVALYIHIYGTLPGNFITKKEAENAGWVSREGNLWVWRPERV